MIGFCTAPDHQDDVPVDADGRCITHGTRTIAPSTSCVHARWINGAWSACDPAARGEQSNACKPVAAGTWRNALGQQARAEKKREQDRQRVAAHDRRAVAGHARPAPVKAAPKQFVSIERPSGNPRRCSACGVVFRHLDQSVRYCSDACRFARYKVGQMVRGLTVEACPVDGTPFVPYMAGGRRGARETCSRRCGAIKAAQTTRARQMAS